jgi:hypothetical protein
VQIELCFVQPHDGVRADPLQRGQSGLGPSGVDRMPQPPRVGQCLYRLPTSPGRPGGGVPHQHSHDAVPLRLCDEFAELPVVRSRDVPGQRSHSSVARTGVDRLVHLQRERVQLSYWPTHPTVSAAGRRGRLRRPGRFSCGLPPTPPFSQVIQAGGESGPIVLAPAGPHDQVFEQRTKRVEPGWNVVAGLPRADALVRMQPTHAAGPRHREQVR